MSMNYWICTDWVLFNTLLQSSLITHHCVKQHKSQKVMSNILIKQYKLMKLNLNTVITNINTNNSALLMFLLARKILPLLVCCTQPPPQNNFGKHALQFRWRVWQAQIIIMDVIRCHLLMEHSCNVYKIIRHENTNLLKYSMVFLLFTT